MMLANGNVVTVSNKKNSDLFHGASNALKNLGITTLLEIQLMQAKKYVRTTYHCIESTSEIIAKIEAEIQNPALDYVDEILFSKNHGVVITDALTDEVVDSASVQRFSDASDP